MKYVILITGASSGFGALTARRLAEAGHIVYATMRETGGRNAKQVEAARKFAAEKMLIFGQQNWTLVLKSLLIEPCKKLLAQRDAST